VLLRLLRLRLRLRRRLLPPPLRERLSVPDRAGAICVNFAISSASCFVEPHRPYEPHDAVRTLEPH
jgi:hypothetical protein